MTHPTPLTQHSNNDAPFRALRPISFYAIVLMVLFADQFSKSWIQKSMAYGQSRPLFGDGFRLSLTQNTGGAWGLLPQGNHWFIVFACCAVIALLVAYHRMPKVELFVGSAFALALGGALGNVTDRIRHGFVVDFIHAKFINFPVFNLADTAITFGIIFLLIHLVVTSREEAAEAKRAALHSEPQTPQAE